MNEQPALNIATIQLALQSGSYDLQGEFVYGSNRTFLCSLSYAGEIYNCVYKPERGERPLWDFASGSLAKREVAAYLLDHALGWQAVPPCVYRAHGPLGAGSLHWFVDHDPALHYFTFPDEIRNHLQFAALFDLLVNNADRKAGHFLLDEQGKVWLIDHGLCFHQEEKLRTVVWDFAGETIPQPLLRDVQRVLDDLNSEGVFFEQIVNWLSYDEIEALRQRAQALVESAVFPAPSEERRMFPWPLV